MTDFLAIRFHYKGLMARDKNGKLGYYGGYTGNSKIDRDRMSLPEIKGHLLDHCNLDKCAVIYCMHPHKSMDDGMITLFKDQQCLDMMQLYDDNGVAELYVKECLDKMLDPDIADFETECIREVLFGDPADDSVSDEEVSEDESTKQKKGKGKGKENVKFLVKRTARKSGKPPTDVKKKAKEKAKQKVSEPVSEVVDDGDEGPQIKKKGKCKVHEGFSRASEEAAKGGSSGDEDGSDSDIGVDVGGSDHDEESEEIRKRYKELKKKIKRGEAVTLDDVQIEGDNGLGLGGVMKQLTLTQVLTLRSP